MCLRKIAQRLALNGVSAQASISLYAILQEICSVPPLHTLCMLTKGYRQIDEKRHVSSLSVIDLKGWVTARRPPPAGRGLEDQMGCQRRVESAVISEDRRLTSSAREAGLYGAPRMKALRLRTSRISASSARSDRVDGSTS